MPFVPDTQSTGNFVPDAGAQPPAVPPFSIADTFKQNPQLLTPWGMAARGQEEINKLIEHGAYKAGGAATDITGTLERARNASREQSLTRLGKTVTPAMPSIAPAAGYATNVGIQSMPVVAGAYLGSTEGSQKAESLANRLMQSALKPSAKDMDTGRGAAAIQTALDRGYNVSSGAAEGLKGEVSGLETKIQNALKASGKTVDKGEIAGGLQDVISRVERTSMNPQDRVAAVEKVYSEVMANQKLPNAIPVAQANEIKQGIYQMLRDKYGELGSDAVEAQKTLARHIKESVGAAEPGVAADLKKQSSLANLLNIMRRRTAVEGNTNIGGLAPLASNPPAAMAFLADKYGLSKSMLANLLHSGAQVGVPSAAGGLTGAALASQLRLNAPEQ